ncbi:MAG TPA: hypothetical protein VMF56_09340 [Acidobacteriaceae bacterium]|nr:hypothetical protein [Acidobacteriaceae bacterium]
MKKHAKLYTTLFAAAIVTLMFSPPALAEDGPAPQPVTLNSPSATPAQAAPSTASDPDDAWHFTLAPYLWFAGMHGTVGARGYDASVHASFGDIFSYLNMGIMVAAVPQYKKFSAPVDFIWMKLSDNKSLPFQIGPTNIKTKVNEDLLTPKGAYRLVDGKMIKVDGNLGIRYFHLGTTLTFVPGTYVSPQYQSANWVDVVSGARIQAALSPKIMATVLGDAGAGGANLDYQIGAFLGYKVRRNVVLQAGWRYLAVNYRPKSTFVYDVDTSGLLIGATINLK